MTEHPWFRIKWDIDPIAAVMAFFLISGFSIRHSIDREPKYFILRRFVRVYPVYLLSLLIAGLPWLILGPDALYPRSLSRPSSLATWIGELFMLQGILTNVVPTAGPSWSLAVEWFYYLISPILKRISFRFLFIMVALSALFYCFGGRGAGSFMLSLYGENHFCLLWLYLLGFMAFQLRTTPVGVGIVLTLCAICMSISTRQGGDNSVPFLVLSAVALLFGDRPKLSAQAQKLMIFLGDVSYPLYLLHIPVAFALWAFWIRRDSDFDLPAVYVILSIVASIIAVYAVDRPCRRLLKRILASKASELPT